MSTANLGTVIGTYVCGLVIDAYDARRAFLVAVAFLAASIAGILLRNKMIVKAGGLRQI